VGDEFFCIAESMAPLAEALAEVKAATAQAQGDGGHHLRGSSSSAATV